MDLGVFLESPQGSQSSSRVWACTCTFLSSCSSSVALPFAWIGDLWLSLEAFPRGFPSRLSHESFPRGFPTGLSHVPPWCESILGLKFSTREEARESRPYPVEPRFRLLAPEEGSFPCVFGKEFPAFPSHLKRRRSPQERREELQGRITIPRVAQMSQCIPGKPVFPALPRLSSRGWTHTTVSRGTAPWESLVGKTRGKASWESLEGKPLIP